MTASASESAAVLITGLQAAGKSTVGRLLAEHFQRGAFIEGDVMWKLEHWDTAIVHTSR